MSIDLLESINKKTEEKQEEKAEEWLTIITELRDVQFPALERALEELKKSQGKSLVTTFEEEENQQGKEVERIKTEISMKIRKFHQILKNLSLLPVQLVERKEMRNNIVSFLLKKLQTYMNDFTVIQNNHMIKLEERESILLDSPTRYSTSAMAYGTKEHELSKAGLAYVDSRHQDIQKIVKDVRELHELFQDMALLVDTQGEMLTVIETNVSKSVKHMEEGKKELVKATVYQKKSRKGLCIFLICLFLFIGLTVLIIKLSIA